jgi:hypothetical protein
MGIQKCHFYIFHINRDGMAFWEKSGWTPGLDIKVMSKEIGADS